MKSKGRRGHYPQLRKFFELSKVPAEILEELLRRKAQRPYLPRFERIAGLINQADKKGKLFRSSNAQLFKRP